MQARSENCLSAGLQTRRATYFYCFDSSGREITLFACRAGDQQSNDQWMHLGSDKGRAMYRDSKSKLWSSGVKGAWMA